MENKDVKSFRFSPFPAINSKGCTPKSNTAVIQQTHAVPPTRSALIKKRKDALRRSQEEVKQQFINPEYVPLVMLPSKKTLEDRVEFIPESGCWIWMGACNKDGYGHIKINGIQTDTHRISWKLFNGPIPKGIHVLHRCDTPSCINPHHLFLGSAKDNDTDKCRKGRWRL